MQGSQEGLRDLSDVLGKGREGKGMENSWRERWRLQWNGKFEAEVAPEEGNREGQGCHRTGERGRSREKGSREHSGVPGQSFSAWKLWQNPVGTHSAKEGKAVRDNE